MAIFNSYVKLPEGNQAKWDVEPPIHNHDPVLRQRKYQSFKELETGAK